MSRNVVPCRTVPGCVRPSYAMSGCPAASGRAMLLRAAPRRPVSDHVSPLPAGPSQCAAATVFQPISFRANDTGDLAAWLGLCSPWGSKKCEIENKVGKHGALGPVGKCRADRRLASQSARFRYSPQLLWSASQCIRNAAHVRTAT